MRRKQKFGKFLGFTFNICENGWLSANIDSHRFHKLFLSTASLYYFQTWLNCNLSEGNYLATRGPALEPFVVGSLIQLLCPVTKSGWLDDDRFKEVMYFLSKVMNFFSFFDFCLFVCLFVCFFFFFWVWFGFVFFLFFVFFSFPPYFLMIASRKYIQLSSPVSYLFSCCVRLLV